MEKAWKRIKLPEITHKCCGFTYNSKNLNTVEYFKCFAHKSLKEEMADINGHFYKVKFCITFWLVCKNNECITSFTFYYGKSNKLITKTQNRGIKYLMKLKDKFLENIELKIKVVKVDAKSKKYLWRYTDKHPKKKFVSNIYTLDDIKVGETEPQIPKIFYE